MDKDIKENWNTVVLALATSGGIIHDVGNKRRVFVRLPVKIDSKNEEKTITEMLFDSFLVTVLQLNQIYDEVRCLQRQVDEMLADREKENNEKESTTSVKNTKRRKSPKKFPPPKKDKSDVIDDLPVIEGIDAFEFAEDPEAE